MLTIRQSKIIKIFKGTNDFVSASKLSKILNVSSKTIRNDIKKINQLFEDELIYSRPSKGFYLDRNILTKEKHFSSEEERNRPFEILTKIIDHENIDYFDLAEEFFISESVLDRTIKDLNKVIMNREPALCIYRKKNKLMIDGNEEQKRQVFNLILNQEIENNKLSLDKYANYFDYCNLEELSQLIVKYHQKKQLIMNDFFLISFILHIAVLLERISKGSYLKFENESKNSLEVKELAIGLIELLEKEYSILIPHQELGYLERLYTGRVMTQPERQDEKIKEVVKELLRSINSTFSIDFSLDKQLEGYLTNHILSLYQRANQQQYLINPLTEELKKQFPFIYNISVYASAIIQEKLDINFPDEEIAYITLHFLSATETINFGNKRQVLLLFPYGIAGQRLARKKIEKITKYSVEVICAVNFQSVTDFSLDNVNLIVTSEELPIELSIKTYKFHSIITDKDIDNIEKLLVSEQEEVSVLNQFFKKELYFPNRSFGTKEEVIYFLCDELAKNSYCDNNYVNKVLARESLSSTSFGNYYALPHAIKRTANKNGIAVCSLTKPIDWSGKKVKLILLIAMREERDNSFEQLFTELVTILSQSNLVKKLSKQDSFEEFLKLCEKAKM